MYADSENMIVIVYAIHVKGQLASHWATWFDGLTITNEPSGEAVCIGGWLIWPRCSCSIDTREARKSRTLRPSKHHRVAALHGSYPALSLASERAPFATGNRLVEREGVTPQQNMPSTNRHSTNRTFLSGLPALTWPRAIATTKDRARPNTTEKLYA